MTRTEIIGSIGFHPVCFELQRRWSNTSFSTECTASDLHPDEYSISNSDLERISDVVGWYEGGAWDGAGFVIVKSRDDLFSYFDMGHCSCYGPWDNYVEPRFTWDEMIVEARKNPEWFQEQLPVYQYAAQFFGKVLNEPEEENADFDPADRTVSNISDSV